MTRYTLLATLFVAAVPLKAATITELFEALKRQPQTQMDTMQTRLSELTAQKRRDALYPVASLYATYEHYSSPTNLRPVSPVESLQLGQNKEPLPFAQTIERIGAQIRMPLFAMDLLSLIEMAKEQTRSAAAKKRLNLLQNEAFLLSDNARWHYLLKLKAALEGRMRSIRKRLEDTRVAVESGRAPGIAADKLEATLTRLEIAKNGIAVSEANIKARIEALTGMRLEAPVSLHAKGTLKKGEIFATKPLEYALKARDKEAKAAKERLYPKITASAFWSENYGQGAVGYTENVGDDVSRGYGNYMINLSMPLFDKARYSDIERAKVALQKERFALQKSRRELEAKAKALQRELTLHTRSKNLARKSLESQKKLLTYAKVAYETGRLNEEEYLRYEEALLEAQSALYEAEAKEWETLAQLAVIYGNDLTELVE